jgi:hypothetical protein
MNLATRNSVDTTLRFTIAGLALASASIHSTLGGAMFTLNAIGFAVLAVALVAPIALAERARWLTRLAVAGYAAATAVGWALFGARYETGYVSFALDLAIVGLALFDSFVADGSPIAIARRMLRLGASILPHASGA